MLGVLVALYCLDHSYLPSKKQKGGSAANEADTSEDTSSKRIDTVHVFGLLLDQGEWKRYYNINYLT